MNCRVIAKCFALAYVAIPLMQMDVRGAELRDRAMAEASSPMYLAGLSPTGKEIWETVVTRSESQGSVISLEDFRQLQIQCPDRMTSDDNLGLFMLFAAMQRPLISKEDLADLAKRQRDSLNPIDVTFSTTLVADFDSTDVPSTRRYVFKADNRNLYLSADVPSQGKIEHDVAAYDGAVLRKLSQAIEGKTRSLPTGVITKLDQRRIFFPEAHPFCRAMLINTEIDRGERNKYESLSAMAAATVVYESPVVVEGENCIVIGNTQRQCYCSIDKNFAVVKNVLADMSYDSSSGRFQPNAGTYESVNRDFVKVNDLTWLPRESLYRVARDGKTALEYTVRVEKTEVGKPIAGEVFSELFPPGTFVQDQNQNIQLSTPSAELAPTANVKKREWSVVVWINLIAVTIVAVVFSSKRLRARR